MAFIEKEDPVVVNIKLTSKGRELLSQGKLKFTNFGVGDSEIDYNIINDFNYDGSLFNILRPMDKNPEILSFITKELNGDNLNPIPNIPSLTQIVENNVNSVGFFNITDTETSFQNSEIYVKQPDVKVKLNEVVGSKQLNLYQSNTYIGNVNEPSIGDYVLVKWDYNGNDNGYIVNINNPTPYLTYKIVNIISGTLSANNLIVEVDRNLPNFGGLVNSVESNAVVLYNTIPFNMSVNGVSNSVLTFLQNYQDTTIEYPYWNLSIIFTEEIAGVQENNKKFDTFNSRNYSGFISYIQNQSPIYKKLGVIHYTNQSPSNIYGEELFMDTSVLDIPTIMWHKSTGNTMGVRLKSIGNIKTLTGDTKALNTRYYDLADENNNIVGKTFIDLKLFVIEDQELLFAMSYKSNRNWTLPEYTPSLNAVYGDAVGCTECALDFNYVVINPEMIDEMGTLIISGITMSDSTGTVIAILESNDGTVKITKSYSSGDTNIVFADLSGGEYTLNVYDLSSPNCKSEPITITVTDVDSNLEIYDVTITEA